MELMKDKSNGTETNCDLYTLKANCELQSLNSEKIIANFIKVTKKMWCMENFEKDQDPLSIYD